MTAVIMGILKVAYNHFRNRIFTRLPQLSQDDYKYCVSKQSNFIS